MTTPCSCFLFPHHQPPILTAPKNTIRMLAKRIRLSAHALNVSAGSLFLFSHLLPIRKQRRNKVGNMTLLTFSPFFSPHFLPFLMSQEEQRKAHKRTFLFAFPWLYTTFGA